MSDGEGPCIAGTRHLAVLGSPPLRSLLAELRDSLNPPAEWLCSEHYEQLLGLCEGDPDDFVSTSFRTERWIYVVSGIRAGSAAAPRWMAAVKPDLVLLCTGGMGASDGAWLSPLRALASPRLVAWLEVPNGAEREQAERGLRAALASLGVEVRPTMISGILASDDVEESLDALRRALDAVSGCAPYAPDRPLLQGLPVVTLSCAQCNAPVGSRLLLWPTTEAGMSSLLELGTIPGCVRSVRVEIPDRPVAASVEAFAVRATEPARCRVAPGRVSEGGYVLPLVCECGAEVGWECQHAPGPRQHLYRRTTVLLTRTEP